MSLTIQNHTITMPVTVQKKYSQRTLILSGESLKKKAQVIASANDIAAIPSKSLTISKIHSWTAQKRNLFNQVIAIMKSGHYEYFTSKPIYHCDNMGSYYIEQKNHRRRGTLKKYRSFQVLVVCCGRGNWNTRKFLVATVL